MQTPTIKTLRRFYAKIKVNGYGCWEWQAWKDPKGYGYFFFNGKKTRAHRASFAIHRGVIPEDLIVMHSCDNPSCVNPEHLFVGTYSDNANDMHSKGRGNTPHGERHSQSKLKRKDIPKIRCMSNEGKTSKHIAAMFNVSKGAIQHVLKGRTWVRA